MFIRKISAAAASTNTHSVDLEVDSSQYLSITDGAQTGLGITGDLTIEAWIKAETFPANNGTIVSKFDSAARSYRFAVEDFGSGVRKMRFSISDNGSGSGQTTVNSTADIGGDTGAWHHAAVVYDASAGTAQFYWDAVGDGNPSGLKTAIYDGAADFRIGARTTSGSPSQIFDGLIDDVRIWSDIRTSSEISTNKDAELTGAEANLVGYWKLNNDLLDSTSNGNDLTNNNSAVFSTDIPF